MRVALLGGSFDPVHIGHLLIADEAASRFGYDRILFVPAAISPHKASPSVASSADRLAMLSAAILSDTRFSVDDCELRRSGVSYTIDTIEDIERRYEPEGKLGLIIGEDLARAFGSWRRVDEIASRTDILLACRPSYDLADFPYGHRRLGNSMIDVSSTRIRALMKESAPWRFLVPEGARRYITERSLYGTVGKAPSGLGRTIRPVEEFAISVLSQERYLHSRGVALLAARLCRRFGEDPEAGYLAGIAHDICKEFPTETIKALALEDGGGLSDIEAEKPSFLHARAAASLLRKKFDVDDESVLEAVRSHTFGFPGMGPLARLVYIADKIEPSRGDVSPSIRASMHDSDAETLFASTVADTVRWLRERGKTVSADTLSLLAERGGAPS